MSDGEPLYTSRVRVEKIAGVHRRGHLPAGATMDMGVHGAVAEYFRLGATPALPLPVDYIVAATAG